MGFGVSLVSLALPFTNDYVFPREPPIPALLLPLGLPLAFLIMVASALTSGKMSPKKAWGILGTACATLLVSALQAFLAGNSPGGLRWGAYALLAGAVISLLGAVVYVRSASHEHRPEPPAQN
jgi:hypothetical protein